ncbi:LysM peptidoglycan-binding domain-containing protein [Streptomyces sp. YC419]|uniref:LysM peptidoglycan-binding domain-containing protein n=2 Tax=Streptomyces ureilyticus TaxID=1775131 RepID=A0ABX0E3I1_9ACTN|nr:LysM peptidoglycan-binding domain-containing protein [Streptomyces ureilyticus]
MLSGNGRHRRPRQAPALLVAAGVTGSAIAIPLFAASGASAASGATWDAVAECESGGSWSANAGNGQYGGLQMTQEEWEQYGGLDYAMSADLASRSQQIAVAEKVLADRGTGPWATCGLVAGLTQNSDSADVDTGLAQDSPTPSPTPSTESEPGLDSGSSSGAGAGTGADSGTGSESEQTPSDGSVKGDSSGKEGASDSSDSSAESDSSGTSESSTGTSQDSGSDSTAESPSPDSSPSPPADTANEGDSDNSGQNADSSGGESESTNTDEATGRHRGGSAEEGAGDSRADDSTGRHASRGDGASRDATDAQNGSYTVRSGDSLSAIADSRGLQGGWAELYAANENTIGADPDLIRPGQRLELDTD